MVEDTLSWTCLQDMQMEMSAGGCNLAVWSSGELSVEPEDFCALPSELRKPDRKWAENQIFCEENLKQDAA